MGVVVKAIKEQEQPRSDDDDDDYPVFLHIFSNGGAAATAHLLSAYRKTTGKPLYISSMVMDSCPGTFDVGKAIKAFSYALPKLWILRFFVKVSLYIIFIGALVRRTITRQPDVISWVRATINDTRLYRKSDGPSGKPRRCYIYSDTDDLINYKDVETHAADAERNDWTVYKEEFEGAAHVGHMRADPIRYWSIVKSLLLLETQSYKKKRK